MKAAARRRHRGARRAAPASSTFYGPGNLPTPPEDRCSTRRVTPQTQRSARKGKVRRHGKCVRAKRRQGRPRTPGAQGRHSAARRPETHDDAARCVPRSVTALCCLPVCSGASRRGSARDRTRKLPRRSRQPRRHARHSAPDRTRTNSRSASNSTTTPKTTPKGAPVTILGRRSRRASSATRRRSRAARGRTSTAKSPTARRTRRSARSRAIIREPGAVAARTRGRASTTWSPPQGRRRVVRLRQRPAST